MERSADSFRTGRTTSCPLLPQATQVRWRRKPTGLAAWRSDDAIVEMIAERIRLQPRFVLPRLEAERALAALRRIVSELGLSLKERKTRIVHLREGDGELDFLGFEHRWVRGRTRRSRHLTFLARWPSRQAMQRARDRIRELTERKRLSQPVDETVHELNRFLRGWGGYFRYGNSARHFDQISTYALKRLAAFVAKRHGRAPGYGLSVVAYQSTNRLGLITLNGTVIAPRAFKPWREKPNADG